LTDGGKVREGIAATENCTLLAATSSIAEGGGVEMTFRKQNPVRKKGRGRVSLRTGFAEIISSQ